jgi:NitT/TauT family transport system substrate-binding protein
MMRRVVVGTLLMVLAACAGADRASPPGTTPPPAPTQDEATGPGTPAPRPLAQPATLTLSKSRVPVGLYANVLLAQDLGEFAKENLTVKFVSETFVDSLVLVQQGRLDGAVLGLGAGVFNAAAAGADVRFVLPVGSAPPDDTAGFWARKELLGPNGLDPCILGRGARPDGKTVVSVSDPTGLGGPATFFLARLIARCPGQTVQSVVPHLTVSNLVGTDLVLALRQGAVDVAFLVDPLNRAPGLADVAGLAVPGGAAAAPPVDLVGWAMGSIRHDKPEVVDAFVRASIRTARTYLQGNYLENPTILSALATELGTTEDVLRTSKPQVFSAAQRINADALAPLQSVWVEVGGLLDYRTPIDASKLIDLGPRDRVGRGP